MEDHFRRLERLYREARCNQPYKAAATITRGAAEVVLATDASMHHAADAVHGSVAFKALDDAGFFAANSLVEDAFVLTSSLTAHFLRPVEGGRLVGRGRVVHASGRQFVCEASAFDEHGNEVARGIGTFVRSRLPLPA
ncbi:MAG: PaaI family thioesterase [Methanobacteriota archaeon]